MREGIIWALSGMKLETPRGAEKQQVTHLYAERLQETPSSVWSDPLGIPWHELAPIYKTISCYDDGVVQETWYPTSLHSY